MALHVNREEGMESRAADTIRALADALDAARAEVAQVIGALATSTNEVIRLANELARYQGMTMHADHPSVIAAERDAARAEIARLRAALPEAVWLEWIANEFVGVGHPNAVDMRAAIRLAAERIRALDAGAETDAALTALADAGRGGAGLTVLGPDPYVPRCENCSGRGTVPVATGHDDGNRERCLDCHGTGRNFERREGQP